jgi:uncharacterized protein involved in exopolysaccharide biosynthesis
VESFRQNTVIHEIGPEIGPELDPLTEVEFPGPAAAAEPSPGQSSWSALEALQLLWQQRRTLYKVAAWSCAIGLVFALMIPNEYESSVSIMPPDSLNGNGTMLAALATKATPELAAMAGNLLGTKSSGALFVDLFRSRTVQDHVIDRLNLQRVYWSRYKQDARKKLDSRTGVSEDRKSGVISLTVIDRSAPRARDIAQAYVEELNRLVSQVSTSSARRERVFIEQRLNGVKSDLEDAEKQFAAFASKNSTLDIKEQTKAMVESAGVLQGQLIASQSELQSLEQIYTGNNVRVRSLQARVDELKRQLQKLQGTDASLAADASQPDQMYPPIRKLPLLGVEWADLYRRMKIQETVYELLNQQYELARIQEAKEVPTVNIVDPANVPERKSFPPRLLIVLLITAASLAAAAAWVIGRPLLERLDDRDPRRVLTVRAATALSRGWERCRQVTVVRWLTRTRTSVAASE